MPKLFGLAEALLGYQSTVKQIYPINAFIKAYLGQGRIFVKLVITVFNLQLAQKLLCLSPLIVKEELKISLTFILAWNTANC
jgi:hypothetical protein